MNRHPLYLPWLLWCVVGCSDASAGSVTLTVESASLRAEVADDPAERARGLMHRDSLGEDDAMLFVYPDDAPRKFWMKDTRIPLSIAYLDAQGKVVKIADMQPLSTESTPSLYPARYALEVNQGWFERHGVKDGSVVHGLESVAPAKAAD